MKKQKAIKELLNLHCIGCNGKIFGCKGCNIENNISNIVNSIKEEVKQTKKTVEKKVK